VGHCRGFEGGQSVGWRVRGGWDCVLIDVFAVYAAGCGWGTAAAGVKRVECWWECGWRARLYSTLIAILLLCMRWCWVGRCRGRKGGWRAGGERDCVLIDVSAVYAAGVR
jgi:hypothetical protein